MDRNFLLVVSLSLLVWIVWGSLVAPPPPPPPGEVAPARQPVVEETPGALPDLEPTTAPTTLPLADTESVQPQAIEGHTVEYDSSLVRSTFDTRGAGLTHWELVEFDSGPNEGREPIVLSTGRKPHGTHLATPLDELGLGDLSRVVWDVEENGDGRIAFRYEREGIAVSKVFSFVPDSYLLELSLRVENRSERTVSPLFALTWPAAEVEGQDWKEQSLAALQQGSVESELLASLGMPGFFGGAAERQIRFDEGSLEWTGMRTTYFLAAMIPDDPGQAHARFVATTPGEAGVAQLYFNPVNVPPGQAAERVFRIFAGPKKAELLEAAGGELVRSIDLGWFWLAPLTRFFHWMLTVLYSFVPNFGLAIILLTVLVRVVTTPLTAKQMRSMERMRALAPKLQALKEKYGDDRQKQSEEMMRLYRQEGVNPLGGCFPMLLQLPVFIGLFYALRSSIDLRHAPFVGWINDLSAPETLFVVPGIDFPIRLLPLVMGLTMLLQQKITPMQQMDPAQQRMMIVMMPVMMTVISWTFPSGLVLYWMVSNVLAIAHQLWVGRGLRMQPQPA